MTPAMAAITLVCLFVEMLCYVLGRLLLKRAYEIYGFIFQFQQNNKIFKRGFNVNAQEWKPSSRRTSVGNASVKDIPMLDVFLQRLDQRHTNYNSDQASPTSNEQ